MSDTRRVPASFMASRILKHPGPIYPKIAKVKHISGVVMLHAVIGKDGTMEKVDPLCGPELLLPSAIEAAKQWTYTPFDDIDGKPLEVETTITMDYAFGPSAVPKPGSGSWINGWRWWTFLKVRRSWMGRSEISQSIRRTRRKQAWLEW